MRDRKNGWQKEEEFDKINIDRLAYKEDLTSCMLGFTNDVSVECENYSKRSVLINKIFVTLFDGGFDAEWRKLLVGYRF